MGEHAGLRGRMQLRVLHWRRRRRSDVAAAGHVHVPAEAVLNFSRFDNHERTEPDLAEHATVARDRKVHECAGAGAASGR